MRFTGTTACLLLIASGAFGQEPEPHRHLDEGALPLPSAPVTARPRVTFHLITVALQTGAVPSFQGPYGHDTDDQGWNARRRLKEQKTASSLASRLAPCEVFGRWFGEDRVERLPDATVSEGPEQTKGRKTLAVYQAEGEAQVLLGVEGPLPPELCGKTALLSYESSVQLSLFVQDAEGFRGGRQSVRVTLPELHALRTRPAELAHTPLGALLRRACRESIGDRPPQGRTTVHVEVMLDQVLRVAHRLRLPTIQEPIQFDMDRVLGRGRAHITRPLPEVDAHRARLLELPPPNTVSVVEHHDLRQLRLSTRALSAEDLAFLGKLSGEVEARTRQAETQLQRALDPFRDARGQVQWGKVGAAGLFQAGSSTARFTLALFLKELAVAAATQDQARLGEFFDFVATTDFYLDYGLFAGGAALGEGLVKLGEAGARGAPLVPRLGSAAQYRRFLRTYVKPRFVSSVLRSNVALAAGLALPQLVRGDFDGKTFAISFASLGISAALVQGALSRIPWVQRVRGAGALGGATRLARLGGWTYQAAELAVILIAGEVIERWWTERDSLAKARQRLSQAAATLIHDGLLAPNLAARQGALAAYMDAWDAYREYLYLPLLQAQAEFRQRLGTLDRQARLDGGTHEKLEAWLDEGRFEGLELEDFAQRSLDQARERGQRRLEGYVTAYQEAFQEGLQTVYADHRRDGRLGFESLARLLLSAPLDLERKRVEPLAQAFAAPHADASRNRLQTYDDQRLALRLAGLVLNMDVREALATVNAMAAADERLFAGDVGVLAEAGGEPTSGLASTLSQSVAAGDAAAEEAR